MKSKLILNERDYRRLIKNLALKSLGYNRSQRRKLLLKEDYMANSSEKETFVFAKGATPFTEAQFLAEYEANPDAIHSAIKQFLKEFTEMQLDVTNEAIIAGFIPIIERTAGLMSDLVSGKNYISGMLAIHNMIYNIAKVDFKNLFMTRLILGTYKTDNRTLRDEFKLFIGEELATGGVGLVFRTAKGFARAVKGAGRGFRAIGQAPRYLSRIARTLRGDAAIRAIMNQGVNSVEATRYIDEAAEELVQREAIPVNAGSRLDIGGGSDGVSVAAGALTETADNAKLLIRALLEIAEDSNETAIDALLQLLKRNGMNEEEIYSLILINAGVVEAELKAGIEMLSRLARITPTSAGIAGSADIAEAATSAGIKSYGDFVTSLPAASLDTPKQYLAMVTEGFVEHLETTMFSKITDEVFEKTGREIAEQLAKSSDDGDILLGLAQNGVSKILSKIVKVPDAGAMKTAARQMADRVDDIVEEVYESQSFLELLQKDNIFKVPGTKVPGSGLPVVGGVIEKAGNKLGDARKFLAGDIDGAFRKTGWGARLSTATRFLLQIVTLGALETRGALLRQRGAVALKQTIEVNKKAKVIGGLFEEAIEVIVDPKTFAKKYGSNLGFDQKTYDGIRKFFEIITDKTTPGLTFIAKKLSQEGSSPKYFNKAVDGLAQGLQAFNPTKSLLELQEEVIEQILFEYGVKYPAKQMTVKEFNKLLAKGDIPEEIGVFFAENLQLYVTEMKKAERLVQSGMPGVGLTAAFQLAVVPTYHLSKLALDQSLGDFSQEDWDAYMEEIKKIEKREGAKFAGMQRLEGAGKSSLEHFGDAMDHASVDLVTGVLGGTGFMDSINPNDPDAGRFDTEGMEASRARRQKLFAKLQPGISLKELGGEIAPGYTGLSDYDSYQPFGERDKYTDIRLFRKQNPNNPGAIGNAYARAVGKAMASVAESLQLGDEEIVSQDVQSALVNALNPSGGFEAFLSNEIDSEFEGSTNTNLKKNMVSILRRAIEETDMAVWENSQKGKIGGKFPPDLRDIWGFMSRKDFTLSMLQAEGRGSNRGSLMDMIENAAESTKIDPSGFAILVRILNYKDKNGLVVGGISFGALDPADGPLAKSAFDKYKKLNIEVKKQLKQILPAPKGGGLVPREIKETKRYKNNGDKILITESEIKKIIQNVLLKKKILLEVNISNANKLEVLKKANKNFQKLLNKSFKHTIYTKADIPNEAYQALDTGDGETFLNAVPEAKKKSISFDSNSISSLQSADGTDYLFSNLNGGIISVSIMGFEYNPGTSNFETKSDYIRSVLKPYYQSLESPGSTAGLTSGGPYGVFLGAEEDFFDYPNVINVDKAKIRNVIKELIKEGCYYFAMSVEFIHKATALVNSNPPNNYVGIKAFNKEEAIVFKEDTYKSSTNKSNIFADASSNYVQSWSKDNLKKGKKIVFQADEIKDGESVNVVQNLIKLDESIFTDDLFSNLTLNKTNKEGIDGSQSEIGDVELQQRRYEPTPPPEETTPEENTGGDEGDGGDSSGSTGSSGSKKKKSAAACRAEWVWNYGFSDIRYDLENGFRVPSFSESGKLGKRFDIRNNIRARSYTKVKHTRIILLYLNYINQAYRVQKISEKMLKSMFVWKSNPWAWWQDCPNPLMDRNLVKERDFENDFSKIKGVLGNYIGHDYDDYKSLYMGKPGENENIKRIVAEFAFLHDALFKTDYYFVNSGQIDTRYFVMEGKNIDDNNVLTEDMIRRIIREKLKRGKK